jgi:hypothetical protein
MAMLVFRVATLVGAVTLGLACSGEPLGADDPSGGANADQNIFAAAAAADKTTLSGGALDSQVIVPGLFAAGFTDATIVRDLTAAAKLWAGKTGRGEVFIRTAQGELVAELPAPARVGTRPASDSRRAHQPGAVRAGYRESIENYLELRSGQLGAWTSIPERGIYHQQITASPPSNEVHYYPFFKREEAAAPPQVSPDLRAILQSHLPAGATTLASARDVPHSSADVERVLGAKGFVCKKVSRLLYCTVGTAPNEQVASLMLTPTKQAKTGQQATRYFVRIDTSIRRPGPTPNHYTDVLETLTLLGNDKEETTNVGVRHIHTGLCYPFQAIPQRCPTDLTARRQ